MLGRTECDSNYVARIDTIGFICVLAQTEFFPIMLPLARIDRIGFICVIGQTECVSNYVARIDRIGFICVLGQTEWVSNYVATCQDRQNRFHLCVSTDQMSFKSVLG